MTIKNSNEFLAGLSLVIVFVIFLLIVSYNFFNKNAKQEKFENYVKETIENGNSSLSGTTFEIETDEEIMKNVVTFSYTIKYKDEIVENGYHYKELFNSKPYWNGMSEQTSQEIQDGMNNYIVESLISSEKKFSDFNVNFNTFQIYENLKDLKQQVPDYIYAYNLKYEDKTSNYEDNLCWYFPPLTKLEIENKEIKDLNNNENYKNFNFVKDNEIDNILFQLLDDNHPDKILNTKYNTIELKTKYFVPVPCNQK